MTFFRNLAEVKESDKIIRTELLRCGIEERPIGVNERDVEVPATIGGLDLYGVEQPLDSTNYTK